MKHSLLTFFITFLLALGFTPVSVFSAEIETVPEVVTEEVAEVFVQEDSLAESAVSFEEAEVTPEVVEESSVAPVATAPEVLPEMIPQKNTLSAAPQKAMAMPAIPDQLEEEPAAPEKGLHHITVDGGVLSPAFTQGVTDYIVTAPYGTDEVHLSVAADAVLQIVLDESQWKWVASAEDGPTNVVTGAVDIASGMAQVHIAVASDAEDSNPSIYNILIETEPASDPIAYGVHVLTDGSGTAYADCESAKEGAVISLFAEAAEDSHFVGWEVLAGNILIWNNGFVMPAEDVSIVARFAENEPPFGPGDDPIEPGTEITIIWMDVDGTPLDQKTYLYGEEEPTTDKIPLMPEDDENTYEFSMWGDATWDGHTVTYYPFWVVHPKYYNGEDGPAEDENGGIVGGDTEEPVGPRGNQGRKPGSVVAGIVRQWVETIVTQAGNVVNAVVNGNTDTADAENDHGSAHAAGGTNGVLENGLVLPFGIGDVIGGAATVTPAAQEAVAILEEKESARVLMLLLLFAFSVGFLSMMMNKRSASR